VEWTLGVEVFFYFLFGLLISTKLFKLNKSSFTVFGVLFLIAQLIVVLLGRLFKIDPVVMHWLPFSYGYMFFLGGLAYYLRERFAKAVYPKLSEKTISDIVLSTILAATIILIAFHKSGVMELTFVLATFLIIVFFKNGGKLSILLDNKILLFLGSISYSFYLLHFNIVPPVTGIVYLDFFIRLAAAVIVSTVWYYIFEKNIYTMVKRRIKSIT
jgi:peptidoglycan/LPS O-acetylase OafA/YrhL